MQPDDPFLMQIFRKNPGMIARLIAGEAVLVPIRSHVGDLDHIYVLNPTAALIWEGLDGTRTMGALLEQVVSEFSVEESEACQDLFDLVADLGRIGAVERV